MHIRYVIDAFNYVFDHSCAAMEKYRKYSLDAQACGLINQLNK